MTFNSGRKDIKLKGFAGLDSMVSDVPDELVKTSNSVLANSYFPLPNQSSLNENELDIATNGEEKLYEIIAEELKAVNLHEATWLKAFSDHDGDKDRATATYIKRRIEQLQISEKNQNAKNLTSLKTEGEKLSTAVLLKNKWENNLVISPEDFTFMVTIFLELNELMKSDIGFNFLEIRSFSTRNTLLHEATILENRPVILNLLNAGANPESLNFNNQRPIDLTNNPEIRALFGTNPENVSITFKTGCEGPEDLKRLFEAGTLLTIKELEVLVDYLQTMKNDDKPIDFKDDISGDTLLHRAAYFNDFKLVKALLFLGFKRSVLNKKNMRPADFSTNSFIRKMLS